MGFYTELFCDNADCASGARHEGPQGPNRRTVTAEARRQGWKKVPGVGWLCPPCAKARADGGEA